MLLIMLLQVFTFVHNLLKLGRGGCFLGTHPFLPLGSTSDVFSEVCVKWVTQESLTE